VIAFYRNYALPWDLGLEQEDHFREILKRVAIGVLLLTVVLSLLPVPAPDEAEVVEVPPRFAKLLLDKPKPPPPPVVRQEPEQPKPEQPKPEKVVKKQPEPKPPVDRVEKARKKAAMAGLLPFADELAELRDNQAIAAVANRRQLAGAAGAARRSERSLITSRAGRASGGINTAKLSRDTGGAGLAGHASTAVSSTVAGLASQASARRSGSSERPARSREEIEMVFDRNKGAIYALYNRALRRDPTLQGKLVLRLTIEPSGLVSACEIVSSELDDEELQRKLVQRVKLFRFAEKDVAPVTTTKPIDFFPA